MADHNHNPTGRNQHGETLKADDERLVKALQAYHREKLTNNDKISKRLQADHGISMHASTVKQRRRALGLMGSAQMDKDPSRRQGVRTIQQRIAFDSGIHLTRDFVSHVMHQHDPEGFDQREPTAKKIVRFPKVPIGIHERWSGDGHDKLYKIGFPIWGVVDDATTAWLDAWVVPSNRMGEIIAYCFLCLVEKYKGIPLQFTTDCGSETTQLHGLIEALRSIFHGDIDPTEPPAHVYLRSVHNISIGCSWLRLRLDFGDNAVIFFNKGIEDGLYDPDDPQQYSASGSGRSCSEKS
ncbi:hypothetical protein A0H81_00262 [Grifola frondosa]|uniref:Integrase catalytic domain-containing protein n=1 Tax=Grifola frondosa TaxID=5627 RepID=A0A1C7MRS1_GRIFR|nr:hypothetical protein A0H81_00262 [Grifola frondosa]